MGEIPGKTSLLARRAPATDTAQGACGIDGSCDLISSPEFITSRLFSTEVEGGPACDPRRLSETPQFESPRNRQRKGAHFTLLLGLALFFVCFGGSSQKFVYKNTVQLTPQLSDNDYNLLRSLRFARGLESTQDLVFAVVMLSDEI